MIICKRAIVAPNLTWLQHQIQRGLSAPESLASEWLTLLSAHSKNNHCIQGAGKPCLALFTLAPSREPLFNDCLRVRFQGPEMPFKLQIPPLWPQHFVFLPAACSILWHALPYSCSGLSLLVGMCASPGHAFLPVVVTVPFVQCM